MKKILVLGNMADLQTGLYIVESAEKLGHKVEFLDTRALCEKHGNQEAQKIILYNINELKFNPDIIIVLKGLELSPTTIETIKNLYKKSILVNWYFDIYIGLKKIWENKEYSDTIKLFDYYFCSLDGVAKKLRDKGFKNVHCLREACFPPSHGEQYINHFQRQKYGGDISFIGNIGFHNIHPNRINILSKIIKEGFDIKIWGNIIGDRKYIPLDVRHHMTEIPVINEYHSIVCQSSAINLGLDAIPKLDGSMSARLYRVMCAGGLYLSTPTLGIDKLFKVNKKDDEITKDQELVLFYDNNDLIRKLDFLLENDDIRESIAMNGQKKVISEHTFTKRINEMLEMIKDGKK